VRPSHLFTGTDADNSADKVRKGRRNDARGERNGSAKMTAAKVLEMRRLAREGMTQWAIARRFGVGQSQVSRIIQRNLWAHI
jgi:DNA invertase Pin-like site-specific DNA recombinase